MTRPAWCDRVRSALTHMVSVIEAANVSVHARFVTFASGQLPFLGSPFLAHRAHLHPALHRLQDAIGHDPRADWSLPAMARVAHSSPRHLARLFAEHAGTSPLHYLRGIRLATARAALHAGYGVTHAAALAGFSSDTQLRRAWRAAGCAGSPSGHGASGGDS